ncbi:50S ribosomal protein L21 [Sphingopyxis sp.]|jgi:large subunit ribosomal protein L21|uniref:50S ribosomal protein L21 n=1 Tax=Sphingopyxis sp. TaxID=1908224 RepID=UPI0025F9AB41|nr:50S ribosomal protein L21 [Sphingopyxis sp.]MBK6412785.1 50S ribosomal protein L21 [Sphingopyxis sp.]
MFAIVRTGGKQYRVAAGDKIAVEKIDGEAGDTVSLGDVLLAGDGGEVKSADGLVVSAEIIAQTRGEKVIVFKKRRRHNYRRRNGHRQSLTLLRILAVGEAKKAAPKKEAAAKTEAAPATEAKAAAPAKEAPAKAASAKDAAPKKEAAPKKAAAPKSEAAAEKAAPAKKPAAKKAAPKKDA